MDKEKKIAEIRENHSTGHYNYNYDTRDAIQFLLSELDREREENRKLVDRVEELQENLIAARENAQSANTAKEFLEEESRKLREDIERIIEILKNGQQAHWQTFKIRQLLGVNGE